MGEVDEERARLSSAYHKCVLSQYRYCVLGVALGFPISFFMKSQLPWAIGGISGTAMDFATALNVCRDHAVALREHEQRVRTVTDESFVMQTPFSKASDFVNSFVSDDNDK